MNTQHSLFKKRCEYRRRTAERIKKNALTRFAKSSFSSIPLVLQ